MNPLYYMSSLAVIVNIKSNPTIICRTDDPVLSKKIAQQECKKYGLVVVIDLVKNMQIKPDKVNRVSNKDILQWVSGQTNRLV